MSNAEFPLAAEFPPATREQWQKLVATVLKGAPFERLTSRTYDRLPIEPLYSRKADARPVLGRAPGAAWQVSQRVEHLDPAVANEQARQDLDNGATCLAVVFAGSIGSYGYGLDASPAAIDRALEGIHPEAGIAVELDLGPQDRDAARSFAQALERRSIDPASAHVRFGFNPLGILAAEGGGTAEWEKLAAQLSANIAELRQRGFRGPFTVADGRPVHAAGGSEAQELAFALASALAYLRALETSGIALDEARRMIFFRLAADADELLTIGKFRALRRLWARVEHACGLAPEPVFVSAETAWRMMTKRDPWVNMLRATIAVFSASVGDADAVSVLPFTAALGLPDAFARRIARNTQLILLEEANLAKVADPAAGSGALEDITEKLCRAAWARFQEIEAAGGLFAALTRGLVQQEIAKVRAEREQAVALRSDILTGTSEFPDIAETPVSVLDVAPRPTSSRAAALRFEPLPRIRLAEPYERLRDASDRHLRERGSRPKIFLANLGPLAAFNARATSARNFFEAGGIEAVTNQGFVPPANQGGKAPSSDLAAMVAAFRASGARLACICSSDEVYAREAEAAARALANAGARHIYLAGKPREREPTLRNSGVKTFIYAGCDTLATLKAAHGMLGLA
jgi:methylmalonyl-CoA mutase